MPYDARYAEAEDAGTHDDVDGLGHVVVDDVRVLGAAVHLRV